VPNVIDTPRRTTEKLFHFITGYWLFAGYVALLTGLFWIANGSLHTKVFYALMAAPALLALILSPATLKALLREPIILAYLAFTAWLLLSLTWSATDTSSFSLGKRPLYVFMAFAACALLASRGQQFLLGALRLGALLAVVAALASLYAHIQQRPTMPRLIGTGALHNPLLTSHLLGFFCSYWLAVWLSRNEQRDWLPILCAIPLLIAIFMTGARTPLLALSLTSLWMLLMTPRRAVYLVTGLMLIALGILLSAPEFITQRGESFRPQIWMDALRQSTEHLWIGRGYDSHFLFFIPERGAPLNDPHNVELAVLLELGIVGLGLWVLMYSCTYWRLLRARTEPAMQIASALVTYGIVAGLTEGSNFLSRPNENWFLIWIPLSLTAALSIRMRQEQR
jgi:O-antigen ligase